MSAGNTDARILRATESSALATAGSSAVIAAASGSSPPMVSSPFGILRHGFLQRRETFRNHAGKRIRPDIGMTWLIFSLSQDFRDNATSMDYFVHSSVR